MNELKPIYVYRIHAWNAAHLFSFFLFFRIYLFIFLRLHAIALILVCRGNWFSLAIVWMCDVWRCENCRAKNQRNKEKLLDRYSKTLFESENVSREKGKIKGNMDGNEMMRIFCVFALNFFLHCGTEMRNVRSNNKNVTSLPRFLPFHVILRLFVWDFFPFPDTVLCMFVCLFVLFSPAFLPLLSVTFFLNVFITASSLNFFFLFCNASHDFALVRSSRFIHVESFGKQKNHNLNERWDDDFSYAFLLQHSSTHIHQFKSGVSFFTFFVPCFFSLHRSRNAFIFHAVLMMVWLSVSSTISFTFFPDPICIYVFVHCAVHSPRSLPSSRIN